MSHDCVARVLVVDDDSDITEFLATCFRQAGHEVQIAHSGEQALQLAAEFSPHLVFLDILIPEQDGWLVCSKLKLQSNCPGIVLMTGCHASTSRKFAEFVHADALLSKPFSGQTALHVLQQHLRGAHV